MSILCSELRRFGFYLLVIILLLVLAKYIVYTFIIAFFLTIALAPFCILYLILFNR